MQSRTTTFRAPTPRLAKQRKTCSSSWQRCITSAGATTLAVRLLLVTGHALVFGPGDNPINLVSVRDVAALAALAVEDEALRNEVVEIGGPENLGFRTLAKRMIEASGRPARIKHIPLTVLRIMSVLARPFSPGFARQANAAVVMNTRDFSFESALHDRFPSLPQRTLCDAVIHAYVASQWR